MMVSLLAALMPLSLISALPVAAGQAAADPAASTEVIEVDRDRQARLTVPVRIGAHGPYRFLIDTGAERTVLSRGVAERLGMAPIARATLIGVAGSQVVDLVEVDEINLGRRSFYGLEAPLLEGHHIGADGIIGLDSLQGQRVLLDFDRDLMAIDEARYIGGDGGYEIVVRARRRSGQLIMTNAIVDGIKTDIVIDTGAQSSIGNRALQRALSKRHKTEQTRLLSVTGQSIVADVGYAQRVRLGGMTLEGMPMAFADSPPFERLGLHDKPAILLGIAQLRAFRRVAIDFDSRKVMFDLRERPSRS